MADQICYSVLCVFSYMAAGSEKQAHPPKVLASTPQQPSMVVPTISTSHAKGHLTEDKLVTVNKSPTTQQENAKSLQKLESPIGIETGSVTPTGGPPSYPPPALPPGVQPPALPPGNIKSVTGNPQVPSSRPGKPPPIPHRTSLTRQPSTPPPPPRPK